MQDHSQLHGTKHKVREVFSCFPPLHQTDPLSFSCENCSLCENYIWLFSQKGACDRTRKL